MQMRLVAADMKKCENNKRKRRASYMVGLIL